MERNLLSYMKKKIFFMAEIFSFYVSCVVSCKSFRNDNYKIHLISIITYSKIAGKLKYQNMLPYHVFLNLLKLNLKRIKSSRC